MPAKKRIALVSGFWGQNIGNAFFNLGGKYVLEQAFPECEVAFIQDQPAYWTFHNKMKGNPKNDLVLLRFLETDYIVLQGPMLGLPFRAIWEETFRALTKKGTKIILLSAALFKYTDEEIRATTDFLTQYPPAIISTRDADTYDVVRGLCPNVHSGIDSGFFTPEVYHPFSLDMGPFVTINFDRFPEPRITVGPRGERRGGKCDKEFDALGCRWTLRFPKFQMRCSQMGKWQAYIGAWFDWRRLPARIGDYAVVRPEHRCNPHVTWKIYRQPNAVASDEPFTYFTIYANAALTLSDRVHACIVTLAYGRPAMLFTPSPRSRLFARLGLEDIKERPVTLDPSLLAREKQAELDFMRRAAAKL